MKCSLGISNFLEEISAAAKSLQLCPTLCDPRDGSPPGSLVPGILQARILEWVAIEISSHSHSIIFLYFLALIMKKSFLSLLAILWYSLASKWVYFSFSPLLFSSLLFSAIFKASSDSRFAFLHFFFLGLVLIPVSCTMP